MTAQVSNSPQLSIVLLTLSSQFVAETAQSSSSPAQKMPKLDVEEQKETTLEANGDGL